MPTGKKIRSLLGFHFATADMLSFPESVVLRGWYPEFGAYRRYRK